MTSLLLEAFFILTPKIKAGINSGLITIKNTHQRLFRNQYLLLQIQSLTPANLYEIQTAAKILNCFG